MADGVSQPRSSRISVAIVAFLEGVADLSRTTFYAMLVSFAVMSGIVLWFFSYDTLAGRFGVYLSRSEHDLHSTATHRALALGRRDGAQPTLLVLGTSTIANALADEAALDAEVDAATGVDWRVAMLATPLQAPLEQVTLIEAALGPPPGSSALTVIAIGVNPLRYGWSVGRIVAAEQEGRLGLRSDWADEEIRRLGATPRRRWPNYLLENKEFVAIHGVSALIRLFFLAPAEPNFAQFAPKQQLPPERRRRAALGKRIGEVADGGDGAADAILHRLAERLRAYPSVRLVLTDAPLSPDLIAEADLADAVAKADRRSEEAARRQGLEYWRFVGRADIPASAYYDDLHVGDAAAQAKLRTAFAAYVRDIGRRDP